MKKPTPMWLVAVKAPFVAVWLMCIFAYLIAWIPFMVGGLVIQRAKQGAKP